MGPLSPFAKYIIRFSLSAFETSAFRDLECKFILQAFQKRRFFGTLGGKKEASGKKTKNGKRGEKSVGGGAEQG